MGKVSVNKKTVSLIQKTDQGEQLVCPITTSEDVYTNMETGERLSDVISMNSHKSLKINNMFSSDLSGVYDMKVDKVDGDDNFIVFRDSVYHNQYNNASGWNKNKPVDMKHKFKVFTYKTIQNLNFTGLYASYSIAPHEFANSVYTTNTESYNIYDITINTDMTYGDLSVGFLSTRQSGETNMEFQVILYRNTPTLADVYLVTIDLSRPAVTEVKIDGTNKELYNELFKKRPGTTLANDYIPMQFVVFRQQSKFFDDVLRRNFEPNFPYAVIVVENKMYSIKTSFTGTGELELLVDNVRKSYTDEELDITTNGYALINNAVYSVYDKRNIFELTTITNMNRKVAYPALVTNKRLVYLTWCEMDSENNNVVKSFISILGSSIHTGYGKIMNAGSVTEYEGDFLGFHMSTKYNRKFIKYTRDGYIEVLDDRVSNVFAYKPSILPPRRFCGFSYRLYNDRRGLNISKNTYRSYRQPKIKTYVLNTKEAGSQVKAIVTVAQSERTLSITELKECSVEEAIGNMMVLPVTLNNNNFVTPNSRYPDLPSGDGVKVCLIEIPFVSVNGSIDMDLFTVSDFADNIIPEVHEFNEGVAICSVDQPLLTSLVHGVVKIYFEDPLMGFNILKKHKRFMDATKERIILSPESVYDKPEYMLSINNGSTGIDYNKDTKELSFHLRGDKKMSLTPNGVTLPDGVRTNNISGINNNTLVLGDETGGVSVAVRDYNGRATKYASIQDIYEQAMRSKELIGKLRTMLDIQISDTASLNQIVAAIADNASTKANSNLYENMNIDRFIEYSGYMLYPKVYIPTVNTNNSTGRLSINGSTDSYRGVYPFPATFCVSTKFSANSISAKNMHVIMLDHRYFISIIPFKMSEGYQLKYEMFDNANYDTLHDDRTRRVEEFPHTERFVVPTDYIDKLRVYYDYLNAKLVFFIPTREADGNIVYYTISATVTYGIGVMPSITETTGSPLHTSPTGIDYISFNSYRLYSILKYGDEYVIINNKDGRQYGKLNIPFPGLSEVEKKNLTFVYDELTKTIVFVKNKSTIDKTSTQCTVFNVAETCDVKLLDKKSDGYYNYNMGQFNRLNTHSVSSITASIRAHSAENTFSKIYPYILKNGDIFGLGMTVLTENNSSELIPNITTYSGYVKSRMSETSRRFIANGSGGSVNIGDYPPTEIPDRFISILRNGATPKSIMNANNILNVNVEGIGAVAKPTDVSPTFRFTYTSSVNKSVDHPSLNRNFHESVSSYNNSFDKTYRVLKTALIQNQEYSSHPTRQINSGNSGYGRNIVSISSSCGIIPMYFVITEAITKPDGIEVYYYIASPSYYRIWMNNELSNHLYSISKQIPQGYNTPLPPYIPR